MGKQAHQQTQKHRTAPIVLCLAFQFVEHATWPSLTSSSVVHHRMLFVQVFNATIYTLYFSRRVNYLLVVLAKQLKIKPVELICFDIPFWLWYTSSDVLVLQFKWNKSAHAFFSRATHHHPFHSPPPHLLNRTRSSRGAHVWMCATAQVISARCICLSTLRFS